MKLHAVVPILCLSALLAGCGACKRFGYEGFGRDDWQKPDEVVSLLGVRSGDTVADLGAGGGYFTFLLSDAVGPSGKVYAVDVDTAMLEYLRQRSADEERTNVEVVEAGPGDPNLPEGSIDLLFTSNTYHHLSDRVAYFTRLKDDLTPNGRVAIVEFSREKAGFFGRTFGHLTAKATIVEEMTLAGYRLVLDDDMLERQSFLIFSPKS